MLHGRVFVKMFIRYRKSMQLAKSTQGDALQMNNYLYENTLLQGAVCTCPIIFKHFFSLKPLCKSKLNYMWSLFVKGGVKSIYRWSRPHYQNRATCRYISIAVKILANVLLNQLNVNILIRLDLYQQKFSVDL